MKDERGKEKRKRGKKNNSRLKNIFYYYCIKKF